MKKLGFAVGDVVDVVALAAGGQVYCFNPESLVSCAFGCAAQVIQPVVQLELAIIRHVHLMLQVIWVHVLAVQKAQDCLKCLLRIAHLPFFVVHTNTVSV